MLEVIFAAIYRNLMSVYSGCFNFCNGSCASLCIINVSRDWIVNNIVGINRTVQKTDEMNKILKTKVEKTSAIIWLKWLSTVLRCHDYMITILNTSKHGGRLPISWSDDLLRMWRRIRAWGSFWETNFTFCSCAFVFESLAFFFDFLNVARLKIRCWRRWQLVGFRSDNEHWSMLQICRRGKSIAHVHPESLRKCLQSSNWLSICSQASLRVCLWFLHWFGDTARCTQSSLWGSDVFPNLTQSLPWYTHTSHQRTQLLLYQSSEIPVTLKAGRNARVGSDTLLKLTLPTLHSTSSKTLLVACRDLKSLCCSRVITIVWLFRRYVFQAVLTSCTSTYC